MDYSSNAIVSLWTAPQRGANTWREDMILFSTDAKELACSFLKCNEIYFDTRLTH